MTNSQARIVDPILSTVAQGYQQNDLVAQALFPTVSVNQRGGNVITFSKESFMLYQTQRSPGESTKRVRFGYASGSYALVDYSLEGTVPMETEQEAMAVPGIDLGAQAVTSVSAIMALRLEKACADMARNAANYAASNKATLSGTSQWSDFGSTSDPIKDVEAAKSAVRAQTGKRPNTLVMGSAVMDYLRQHPKIVDRMKYTGRDVATAEMLASLFGVERVLEGSAIFANDAGAFADVWGKDVVLAYTNTASVQAQGLPSYGYTYNLSGYPMVEEPYMDRNAKSWVYPVTRAEAPVIAAASAGFLLVNAVA
jgi:microcystin-dependent protein